MKALEMETMENVQGGEVDWGNLIACAGGVATMSFICAITTPIGCAGASFVIGGAMTQGC